MNNKTLLDNLLDGVFEETVIEYTKERFLDEEEYLSLCLIFKDRFKKRIISGSVGDLGESINLDLRVFA